MEQNNMVEVIKADAVITIKLNRDFYARLTVLFRDIVENKTQEEMAEAAKQIEEGNVAEMWIFNYETMIYLLKACEDYCKENNMTETMPMEELAKLNEKASEEYLKSFENKTPQ